MAKKRVWKRRKDGVRQRYTVGKRKKKRVMDFKSKEDYKRWLAYGHARGVFKKTPGHTKVKIRGKPYKVKHGK